MHCTSEQKRYVEQQNIHYYCQKATTNVFPSNIPKNVLHFERKGVVKTYSFRLKPHFFDITTTQSNSRLQKIRCKIMREILLFSLRCEIKAH